MRCTTPLHPSPPSGRRRPCCSATCRMALARNCAHTRRPPAITAAPPTLHAQGARAIRLTPCGSTGAGAALGRRRAPSVARASAGTAAGPSQQQQQQPSMAAPDACSTSGRDSSQQWATGDVLTLRMPGGRTLYAEVTSRAPDGTAVLLCEGYLYRLDPGAVAAGGGSGTGWTAELQGASKSRHAVAAAAHATLPVPALCRRCCLAPGLLRPCSTHCVCPFCVRCVRCTMTHTCTDAAHMHSCTHSCARVIGAAIMQPGCHVAMRPRMLPRRMPAAACCVLWMTTPLHSLICRAGPGALRPAAAAGARLERRGGAVDAAHAADAAFATTRGGRGGAADVAGGAASGGAGGCVAVVRRHR